MTRLRTLPSLDSGLPIAGRAASAPIDPSLDLEAEIQKLKKEKNAVVLAHYYQDSDVQDVADFLGDSLQLAQAAKTTEARIICFCGVHFMAETAKILNPDRTVVVPDLDAGCSLADGCPPDRFRAWKAQHPGAVVVSYINCSAEIKAESDWIVTLFECREDRPGSAARSADSVRPRQEPGSLDRAANGPQAGALAG